jgi:hypothetical protein
MPIRSSVRDPSPFGAVLTLVDECITGDALVALVHSDLKDMGISSTGHRLTILKGVYTVKMKQNIPIEPDHYVPLCKPLRPDLRAEADRAAAESGKNDAPPTQADIARIIDIIKDRDAEIRSLREDLVRISEENRKLREDLLPLVRLAKDRSQPLPTPDDAADAKTGGLSRKYSNKRIFLSNNGPKNPSPTIQEGRTVIDGSGLDPSAAAMVASTHLTASVRDGGIGSPNQPQPSPTSPAYRDAPGSGGPTSRPFPRTENSEYGVTLASTPALSSSASAAASERMSAVSERISSASTIVTTPPTGNLSMSGSATTPSSGGAAGGGTGSASSTPGPPVEIFKSFRVSIEDPCYKVLPVALKKYNIAADWRQYALYIVYGDQERCLGLTEKPLILFKQLDREGRKPMFMLRKHAAPAEGHISVVQPPAASIPGSAAALPGGVL